MQRKALLAACFFAALSSPALAASPAKCNLGEVQPFLMRGLQLPENIEWLTSRREQYVEPFRAFDNLWYVGGCFVGAWIITTPQGAILIDTLYEPLSEMLFENLAKAGVKPESVRYVVITHGHWDHVGGAGRLKPLLPNAQFVMSARGWEEAANTPHRPGYPEWKMIARERVAKDGETIELGGTKLTIYETPGHSAGTISFAFDVADDGKPYRAFTIGGLATFTITSSAQAGDYVASVKRVQGFVADDVRPVEVYVPTHLFLSRDVNATAAAIRARKAGEPHPMVDRAGFSGELDGLLKGGEAKLDSERKAGR
jgi:metallo-beta-lactamase class B